MNDQRRLTADAVYRLVDRHESLKTRRFELLPLTGDGAAFTDVQGRGWGSDPTTSPAELADLISSIGTVGQLQPILVEELPDAAGRLVVSGERRLLALRWGSINQPDNPHFRTVATVLVDGPLTEEERRCWQLVENLARADLKPGELAAALMYERCAVLAARLVDAGATVPPSAMAPDDPIERFAALDRVRTDAGHHHLGAPWRDVIQRIGIQLSEHNAQKLVRAFRALPTELSADMDAEEVSLASRLEFAKLLHRGRAEAADEIWAALKERDRPDLLTRAVTEAITHPAAEPIDVVDAAEAFHEAAAEARMASLRGLGGGETTTGGETALPPAVELSDELTTQFRNVAQSLLEALRAGATPSRYDRGSLHLVACELLALLAGEEEDLDGGADAA